MIVVKISEPYHRPSLKPGRYVTVDLCTQVDFYGGVVNEDTPFYPKLTYSPIGVEELRCYLKGLHHLSEVLKMDAELMYEAPMEVRPLLPEGARVR